MFLLYISSISLLFQVNKKRGEKKRGSNSRRKGIYRIYRTGICKKLVENFAYDPTNLFPSRSNFHERSCCACFFSNVSRCCCCYSGESWTTVQQHRSGNNDHEYFSLLHNASMARYSSSRVITAAPRRIHVAIRTRRCASRAHRCIQH